MNVLGPSFVECRYHNKNCTSGKGNIKENIVGSLVIKAAGGGDESET